MNFTQISQGQKSLFTKRIIFTILLFLIFQDANARRWYVNPNKLLGVFDGGSWTTAYNNLGQCLPNVTAGDEVWITRGKDRPYGSGRDKTIEIPSGVKLYGAFGGFETSISQRRFLHPFEAVRTFKRSQGNNHETYPRERETLIKNH